MDVLHGKIPLPVPEERSARSRLQESRDRFDFIFAIAENWTERAVPLPPSQFMSVINEVDNLTKRIPLDYRDDLNHDLVLAAFEGRITRSEIGQMVKPFLMLLMKNSIGARWAVYTSLNEPMYTNGSSEMKIENLTQDDMDAAYEVGFRS